MRNAPNNFQQKRTKGTKKFSFPFVISVCFCLFLFLVFASSALAHEVRPAYETTHPLALLFFSGGVETGHLLFVATVLRVIAVALRAKFPAPRWAQLVPPYAIGTAALFWVIQRIATL